MQYIDISKLNVSPFSAITNVVALNDDGNIIKAEFDKILIKQTTYQYLRQMAINGELTPNKQYRFAYTMGDDAFKNYNGELYPIKSAKHKFDLIVTAISKTQISKKVKATYNEEDTYFKDNNCDVESWEIEYNLDCPYFDSEGEGEDFCGWVTRMTDENNLSAPYDFKNLLWLIPVNDVHTNGDIDAICPNYFVMYDDIGSYDRYYAPTFSVCIWDNEEVHYTFNDISIKQGKFVNINIEGEWNGVISPVIFYANEDIVSMSNINVRYGGYISIGSTTNEIHNIQSSYNCTIFIKDSLSIKLGEDCTCVVIQSSYINVGDENNVIYIENCADCDMGSHNDSIILNGCINISIRDYNSFIQDEWYHNATMPTTDAMDNTHYMIYNCNNMEIGSDNIADFLRLENSSDVKIGNCNFFTHFETQGGSFENVKIGNQNDIDYLGLMYYVEIGNFNSIIIHKEERGNYSELISFKMGDENTFAYESTIQTIVAFADIKLTDTNDIRFVDNEEIGVEYIRVNNMIMNQSHIIITLDNCEFNLNDGAILMLSGASDDFTMNQGLKELINQYCIVILDTNGEWRYLPIIEF